MQYDSSARVSWWVDLREVPASTNGGFQKMKLFFPDSELSFEMTRKSWPVSFFECSSGFAIVAEDRMHWGFEPYRFQILWILLNRRAM